MKIKITLAIAATAALMSGAAIAEEKVDGKALAKALPSASVTLEQGLKASEAKGKPISAKYEVEDGALQLSVYTSSGNQFFEVVVDNKTGKISKTEEIKDGDDLKEAKEQTAAMSKATTSLEKAATDAEKANAGYRAVSVEAETKGGHPVAEIVLLKGTATKKIDQKLD